MTDSKTTFKRVDADTVDKLVDKGESIDSVLSDEEKERLATFAAKLAASWESVSS